MTSTNRITKHLNFLYGETRARQILPLLEHKLSNFSDRHPQLRDITNPKLSEKDSVLITYGDQINEPGAAPLKTLAEFLAKEIQDLITIIHILPFYPYSSDDGFSVIDYRQVDPDLGTWRDITRLGKNFRLMFDAVINHISRQSEWFKNYLQTDEEFQDYFITVEPDTDLSMVVRPRALPLLTPVETVDGKRYVWTTFSSDQIDLNYANPDVLLEIIDLLLFYIENGAEIIRLDAIAYLWKEVGTSSIHLPQTHHVVKLFRAVLDVVAPGVILITETNVPHEENISYFGEPLNEDDSSIPRGDEAQMVYQFSLAPLVLHTFLTGDSRALTEWARSLVVPFSTATYFNFIASHDGIGIRPAEGLLSQEEIQALTERTQEHGGQVSYKTNSDGTQSAYELNITLFDALNNPHNPQPDLDVDRFLASQAIMLSLAGVPGIYVHSLFGSRNCYSCYQKSGRARSLNREKFKLANLEAALLDPESNTSQVFSGYKQLLQARKENSAFHPFGAQKVFAIGDQVFAVLRSSPRNEHSILCLVNVSPEIITIDLTPITSVLAQYHKWTDLITHQSFDTAGDQPKLTVQAYQYLWLSPTEV